MSRKYLWDLVTCCEEGREKEFVIMHVHSRKNCGIIEEKKKEIQDQRLVWKGELMNLYEEFEVPVVFGDRY